MSVMSMVLPRNSNFAMAHDAAIPKTRLRGTAMAATVSVSQIAAHMSGSSRIGDRRQIPVATPRRRRRQPVRRKKRKKASATAMRNRARRPPLSGTSSRAREFGESLQPCPNLLRL